MIHLLFNPSLLCILSSFDLFSDSGLNIALGLVISYLSQKINVEDLYDNGLGPRALVVAIKGITVEVGSLK